MKPRMLVLASTYPRWKDDPEPGFVHELSRRLVGRFDVTVLCPHASRALPREYMDGVEIIRYHYAPARWETLVNDGGVVTNLKRAKWKLLLVPGFVLMQAWLAWRLVRSGKVDVIHAHWLLPQGLIAALVSLLSGRRAPFVVTSHGADLYALQGRVFSVLKRFVVRKAAAATVVSGAMREHMQAQGMDVTKILVMPMGVDMSGRFHLDKNVLRSNTELLFVGRLVEKKGLKYLLDAMPAVVRNVPDVTLTVAGFGPEESALKSQVRALGLDSQVHFIGAVTQSGLPTLYRRAALFVAPFVRAESGDEEGLGLVLVEAIGCGCPILVGNVPAVREVLGDEFDRIAVDPTDAVTLATRIISVLNDPVVAREQAIGFRKARSQCFDWGDVAGRYEGLLHNAALS